MFFYFCLFVCLFFWFVVVVVVVFLLTIMKVRKVKIGARYQLGERLEKEGEGLKRSKDSAARKNT